MFPAVFFFFNLNLIGGEKKTVKEKQMPNEFLFEPNSSLFAFYEKQKNTNK